MNQRLMILLLFTLSNLIGFGQENTAIKSVNITADTYIGQDHLGAFYYIKDKTLFKKTDNSIIQFAKLSFGKIQDVDISNPLRIVILYEQTQQVVLLDNQLNELKTVNFSSMIPTVTVNKISNASMNKLWLFESCTSRVYLYDIYSDKIQNLTTFIKPSIVFFQSTLNNAFWVDKEDNWFRCDIFGEIELIGKLPKFESIQFIDDKIALLKINNGFYKYHVYSRKFDLLQSDLKTDAKCYYSNQKLSIFTDDQILIYNTKID